jgi:hypothetical protein
LSTSDSTANTAAPSQSPSPVETVKSFSSQGCIEVSEDLLESISLGIQNSKPTGRAAGFDARDFSELTFVAVEFIPNGTSDPQVAVFAINDDDVSDVKLNGLIVAVDGFARNFSDWGESLNLDLSIADRGAMEAKDCVSLPGMQLAAPVPEVAGFDEASFLIRAGEEYGQFDETYDDGSSLTVMAKTRAICAGSLSTMKTNLGDKWATSFQKFAIESFCPSKTN